MKKIYRLIIKMIYILMVSICFISIPICVVAADYYVESNANMLRLPGMVPIDQQLSENKVENASGNWVRFRGAYNSSYANYNCYAYAIHRAESISFYETEKQYQPGDISGQYCNTYMATVEQLAEVIKADLQAMNYSNIVIHQSLPTVSSTEELICVRKGGEIGQLYHFMRYDYVTDAWYHKPGTSAILKYDYIPSNDMDWHLETFTENGVVKYDTVYDSDIVFITYSKNIINIGESANKSIKPGKDILCEINIVTTGDYTLRLSSDYFVKYELYNEDFDVILSGNKYSETVGFQATAGTYYLRMNFETYNAAEHSVNVSVTNEHTHSYTHHYIWKSDMTHWSYCSCGNEISQPHVVSSSHSTICMLCRGMAGGGLLNSIPGDLPHTENGSYILPSGVIVLVPEDEEAYLNGTLEFRTGEIM